MKKGRDKLEAEPDPALGDGGEPDPVSDRTSGITDVTRIGRAGPTSDIFDLRGGGGGGGNGADGGGGGGDDDDDDAHLRALVQLVVARLRGRFQRLLEKDWLAVEDRVVAALRSADDGADELRIRYTLFQAVFDVDRERWAEDTRWDRARLARWLEEVERGIAALPKKTRACFFGMGLIEAVLSFQVEAAAVDEILAIASSAPDERDAIRQRASRAWRHLCGKDDRSGVFSRHVAQRFVMPIPPLAAWRAAHDLVEAVLGLQQRYRAHQAQAASLKAAERRRSSAWKSFVLALHGSSIQPADVAAALCAQCAQLGIDDRVVPASLRAHSWQNILCGATGSVVLASGPWRAFLAANGFGPAVIEAFTALEQSAVALKDHERDAEAAWNSLLDTAERVEDFGAVKNAFWGLVAGL